MSVRIGTVATWDTGCSAYEQARKVIEEALEVLDAQVAHESALDNCQFDVVADCRRTELLDECADVITATCNLMALFGVDDAAAIMAECAERQRERGRL